jgi:hypothetical protein
MSSPNDKNMASAPDVGVQRPCSSYWVVGWHRAAMRRLLDDALPATDVVTVKALMRHRQAIRRLDETNA